MSTERPTPETDRTHTHCATCDWLAREAERTAKTQGTDHWSSYDGQRDGTQHAAHYLDEDGPR